jgi:hypothetical protein
MDFERKFEFFQKSYIGQLCITDPSYGGHDQEILCFGHFMPKPPIIAKTVT